MKISWRETKTNDEVLKLADEQLYIILTMSTEGENKQRKAKNGVDDKYHGMDGNAIRKPRETGSRSGAMEDHDSQHSQRRQHLHLPIPRGHLYCFVFSPFSNSHPPYFSIFPKVKRSAYVIVDLDAIRHNVDLLRGCCDNSHTGETQHVVRRKTHIRWTCLT